MDRTFTFLGALLGGLAVVIGAFAAHGLEARLDAEALAWVETGARYQMFHALALLAVAAAAKSFPGRAVRWAGWSFVAGTAIFSGSLYVLAATGVRGLGAVTPFGGAALILGWACLTTAAARRTR
ncbi:MAG: DUF423 domain-containing protein [Planctomycetota bacterium JB042]